jgi:MFS family permease
VLLVHQRHLSLFGRGDQGTAGVAMGWMVIVDAAFMFVAGRLGDRRRAHASIAAFGLAMLVPALAVIAWSHAIIGLLVGLTLVGVGTGALGPSLLALIGDVVAPDRRGLAVGALQVCGDVGGALGPLVGTALFTTNVATPYLVSAALAAAFLPLTVRLVRAVEAARG